MKIDIYELHACANCGVCFKPLFNEERVKHEYMGKLAFCSCPACKKKYYVEEGDMYCTPITFLEDYEGFLSE